MKLQACHQCGAQFDVSQFAPGQKFTCGSCGAVLTAHVAPAAHKAPAARPSRPEPRGPARAAPSRQAAQPKRRAAAAAGGGRRGPQYRPPERHQEAKTARRPAKPKAAARSARPAARSRGEARAKKGVNPALIYGAGGLLVAAVLLFLVFANSGKKADDTAATNPGATTVADTHPGNGATGTTPSGTGTPEKADTLASLQAEVAKADLRDASDYTSLAKRFLALGTDEAKEEARSLYETLIKQVAPNNAEARAFLGYTDFQKDILGKVVDNGDPIPEAINNRRGYPFLDAVVKFNERRWLDDDDEIQLAREAVAKMREHQKRLETDRAYHLGDIVRANIALDPMLGDLNYEMYWKAPYLVVYSTSEALSDFDLLDKTKYPDKKAREKAKAALAEKRKGWSSVLKEKAAIFQSVYKEFMRRFGEKFDLKPLDAPWGGRPDYEGGDRRFEYGVPMVIWIFNNADEFHKYHEKRLGQKLPPGVAGYFTPTTGWIFLYDEGGSGDDRIFEINKTVHEGTHQLEYWFTRQKNKWRDPKPTQDAFSEGLAEYLGSVQMQKGDRSLKFIEVNVPRLMELRQIAKTIKDQTGKTYMDYLIPAKDLLSFSSYFEANTYAQKTWGKPGLGMPLLYEQGWAFTYFLNHYDGGKYRDNWLKYFDSVFHRQVSRQTNLAVWKRAFGIKYEDEWKPLEADWEKYFKEVILPMSEDLSKWSYTPPTREDPWPDEANEKNQENVRRETVPVIGREHEAPTPAR